MRTEYTEAMAEQEKDPAAQDMARKRWAKTTKKQRSEVAKKLNEARWGKKPAGKAKAGRKASTTSRKAAPTATPASGSSNL